MAGGSEGAAIEDDDEFTGDVVLVLTTMASRIAAASPASMKSGNTIASFFGVDAVIGVDSCCCCCDDDDPRGDFEFIISDEALMRLTGAVLGDAVVGTAGGGPKMERGEEVGILGEGGPEGGLGEDDGAASPTCCGGGRVGRVRVDAGANAPTKGLVVECMLAALCSRMA